MATSSSSSSSSCCGGAYLCGTPACGQHWTALQKPELVSVLAKVKTALSEGGSVVLGERSNPCGIRYTYANGVYRNSRSGKTFASVEEMIDNLFKTYMLPSVDGLMICSPSIQCQYLKSDLIVHDYDPNDNRCC